MKKELGILLLVLAITLSLAACGDDDGKDKDDRVTIKTTVYPLQSFAEQTGGKHMKVSPICPAGTDLHSYESTQKDILSASKSDLFMYTGDSLDPVAKKVASTVKDRDKKLSLEDKLGKAKLLTDQYEHGEEHKHEGHDHEKEEHHHYGGYDPYVWLDPKINQAFAKEIRDELVKKDPEHEDDYEKNYKRLNDDLRKVDNDMK